MARIVISVDTNVACPSKDDSSGIPDILQIAVGCRVMPRRNLWTEGGLVNGSIGTVRAIVYDNKHEPPKHPAYILVEFDSYAGPYFYDWCFPTVATKGLLDKTWNCAYNLAILSIIGTRSNHIQVSGIDDTMGYNRYRIS